MENFLKITKKLLTKLTYYGIMRYVNKIHLERSYIMVLRTVDELGRVVIPSVIRDMLGIEVKSKVSVEIIDGAVVMRPVKTENEEK